MWWYWDMGIYRLNDFDCSGDIRSQSLHFGFCYRILCFNACDHVSDLLYAHRAREKKTGEG